jgi:primosomal protein N'
VSYDGVDPCPGCGQPLELHPVQPHMRCHTPGCRWQYREREQA